MVTRREVLQLAPVGVGVGLLAWAAAALEHGQGPAGGVTAASPAAGTPSTSGPAASPAGQTPTLTPSTPVTTGTTPPGTGQTASYADRSARATAALARKKISDRVVFGVAMHNASTGETFSYRGGTSFETASIVKADILAALLVQAQDDGRSLSSTERSWATRMITVSDNNAASALWRRAGGASGVRATNRRLGLEETATTTASWGLTRTTAEDQVRLLAAIARDQGSPLSAKSAAYELGLMAKVSSTQDWGVPAIARRGEKFVVKNGWLPRSTDSYRWIVNSIGRVTGPGIDLRVAVLSRGSLSMGAGIKLVESVAKQTRATLDW